ncbi:MAG TPA: transcriptional regulator [Candidatus Methanofastidiosa archaeon]|nr:transcriptional regulator [Candidatus Methanofastidiosa archaeon]HPR41606.1 transcriptional regulator [Candidatus Methanofastidiosa archaeon]
MGQEKSIILNETKKIFKMAGFDTSICDLRCCFDIVAKGKSMTFLIIVAPNIDSIPNDYISSMKCLCYYFRSHPLIIGSRTKNMELLEGVVYTRDDIPALSIGTLEQLIVENAPPLVYSDRGGIYVKIDGELLKKMRENMGTSISEFSKEIGISKSTLYDYEHSKRGVELSTALRIEEFIDYPLIKPVDIINQLIEKRTSIDEKPKSEFERYVFNIFDDLGFKVHPTNKTPFDAVVKGGTGKRDMVMLTGVSDLDTKNLKRRVMILHDVSRILDRDAFFVINSKTTSKAIEGLPIVLVNEIKRLPDSDTVLEILDQRKRECDEEID